ncbi:SIMPL domain-containing protein [Patescibacteria group bacterium]|nr:SIMPL domain-containing protein [Patescibacteria group bacterium]
MSEILNSKLNQLLITLVLVGFVVALGSYAFVTLKQQAQWGGPTTINVSGTGEVMATPDIAQFSFSVRGEGADAAAAQAKSAEVINAVTAYLKENGIEDKDIKTEGYNMNPKYKFEQKPCLIGSYCPPGEQIPDGFEVYQTITVKVRVIDKAGTLLSGIGDKGATDISGLTFTIDDDEALKDEARKLAIEDAQAQAEILADSLDVKIVKMISYYEDSPMEPMYGGGMMGVPMSAKAEMAPTPNIPTGENKTVSNVTITYEVK